mgnify:CR=1 FL=1|jgi:hypothetical protein
MPNQLHHHQIEYLASTRAKNDNDDEEVVVLTIRLPDSFQAANLGISKSEAERLLQDLQRLLAAAPLLLTLLLGTGCSTRVDVSTEHSNGAESSTVHTNVELNFLADQSTRSDPSPAADCGRMRFERS